jgi:hypothetical protein
MTRGTMTKLLKHRGVQVILILALYLSISHLLPLPVHQGFYTISLFIKDLLIWMMPITVGFFIADAICSFEKKAPFFILILVLFEALSNFSSVWYAFGCAHLAGENLPQFTITQINQDFSPLWRLPFSKPSWWAADKGTMVGLCLGLLSAFYKNAFLKTCIQQGKKKMEWMLTRIFSRLIPLFVLGFVVHMHQTHLLNQMLAHYATLLVWLVLFLAIYILSLFFIGTKSFSKGVQSIKNLMPAGAVAFTSGCSLSTMPWTIEGTGKNLRTPSFAKVVIPATTNIQQIGDCIANTFLCFLIFKHFYGINPDLLTWLTFSVVFVLARFATAAVLGGAIFIMLPIYESSLHFNPEMIAIILAFNVILDPIITTTNVIANGALCRIFERVWMRAQTLFAPKQTD